MSSLTLREFLAMAFRRKHVIIISFVCISALFGLLLLMEPHLYNAEMKILVKQSRVDPLVTSDSQLPQRVGNLTEQDLGSEAELLKSRDILERAAIECNVQQPKTPVWAWVPVVNAFAATTKPAYKAQPDLLTVSIAVRNLEENIRATPVRNSNLISVTYPSKNPTLAACVLKQIGRLYLDKHLAVHRAGGTFEFFKQEADRYKQELEAIETDLTSFGQREQLVTEGTEKDITVRKLSDYTARLLDTKTSIAETQARIRKLESLGAAIQPRTQRAVRTAPNEALKELQTQLVTLELKRTEMLGKFAPTYRPLQDLEKQIQNLKNTMADVQKHPLVEETTDADPANEWVRLELTKARSELAALQAGAPVKEHTVQEYRSMVLDLDQKNIKRADLVRIAKATEEKYLLYLRKQEESRIEQELDRQRILNVAIAEDPTVPILPEPSQLPLNFAGLVAAIFSLGIGFGADYYDRSLRSPEEVEKYLGIPVVASVPLLGNVNNLRVEKKS